MIGLLVLMLTLGTSRAQSATATATMAIGATVLSVCAIVALPMVFGNYSSAQLDATAVLTVTCTLGTTYQVGLSPGLAIGATVTTRKMGLAGASLPYGLYADSARSVNWGQTVGTDTMSGTGTGLPQALTVYGRIPAGAYPAPGVYVDTVTATVTY